MLAIVSAFLAGVFVFYKSGLLVAAIASVAGYAAFAAFAYVRSGMLMNDPINMLSISVGQQPSGVIRVERFVSAILIPSIVAYGIFRFLS